MSIRPTAIYYKEYKRLIGKFITIVLSLRFSTKTAVKRFGENMKSLAKSWSTKIGSSSGQILIWPEFSKVFVGRCLWDCDEYTLRVRVYNGRQKIILITKNWSYLFSLRWIRRGECWTGNLWNSSMTEFTDLSAALSEVMKNFCSWILKDIWLSLARRHRKIYGNLATYYASVLILD